MLTRNPKLMNLAALGMAKTTYGALAILRRYLGDDLSLGLIGFAVVLRTRRDLFDLVNKHGLSDDVASQIARAQGFYTSINEISRFTDINRATVRRKMEILKKDDILEKVDDDKWHLNDFDYNEDVPAANMLRELLHNYVAMTAKLEDILPEDVTPIKSLSLSSLGPTHAFALQEDEVEDKIRRGLRIE